MTLAQAMPADRVHITTDTHPPVLGRCSRTPPCRLQMRALWTFPDAAESVLSGVPIRRGRNGRNFRGTVPSSASAPYMEFQGCRSSRLSGSSSNSTVHQRHGSCRISSTSIRHRSRSINRLRCTSCRSATDTNYRCSGCGPALDQRRRLLVLDRYAAVGKGLRILDPPFRQDFDCVLTRPWWRQGQCPRST
jgi:hypothetical protein